MKEYFILQYKLINRYLKDIGFRYSIIGYVLILAGFIGLSFYLFYKTQFAEYLLILGSAGLTSKLSEKRRNDFLKLCFSKRVTIVRIAENLIVSAPFVIFLIYKQCYLSATILLVVNTLMALANFSTSFNLTIPTPFYKKPFEFTVGFRNTFYIFAIAYCLTAIAMVVENFNLGIFAVLLVFFTTYSYYLKPENEFYVWIHALSIRQFLFEKIKSGIVFSSLLVSPILLGLGLRFCSTENLLPMFVFVVLGIIFLTTVILMKYSAYPNEINLFQAILIGLSMVFPPLLIIVIPIFFNQSVKQLSLFLK